MTAPSCHMTLKEVHQTKLDSGVPVKCSHQERRCWNLTKYFKAVLFQGVIEEQKIRRCCRPTHIVVDQNLSFDYKSSQQGQNAFNVRNEVDQTAKEHTWSVWKRVIWHFESANLFGCPKSCVLHI